MEITNGKEKFEVRKASLMQFPTLAKFINENPDITRIEIPEGMCTNEIVSIILDADKAGSTDFATLNIEETLVHLCGLEYLGGNFTDAENHLTKILKNSQTPLRDLLALEKLVNFLHQKGVKICF